MAQKPLQEEEMTQTTTGIEQVGRVMIPVSDQDAAIDFYTAKLGFELRGDTPFGDGDRWVEVGLPGAQTTIALIIPPAESGITPGGSTMIGLSSSDVDAAHAALKGAGVDVDEEVTRHPAPVPPMFWFRDQDENILLIAEEQ
jgi:catechol 2,3-dioxygenase-like lactoylglutathione lyase family enzyme